jgi:hypothetical protein
MNAFWPRPQPKPPWMQIWVVVAAIRSVTPQALNLLEDRSVEKVFLPTVVVQK